MNRSARHARWNERAFGQRGLMAAKVVLVEPDPEQREQFLNAIQGSPFEVCEAVDTNVEAVAACERLRPHLVVLQLVSGKLGANPALRSLSQKHLHVRVVVSYNVQSTHLLMSAYKHGAVAAVKQPFKLHRVVQKLTFGIASERHEKLGGPIVRLEHPFEVRYKGSSLFSMSRRGFCGKLGFTDMDLNIEKPLKDKTVLKLELLLPPPTGTLKFTGVVESAEMTRPDNWCTYVALRGVATEQKAAVEKFIVKAAKKA
jgi:AmiR/NasT family two-component response regulator